MDLTIEECQFMLNAVNAQAMSGFKDGLAGSQRAMVIAAKLQVYATELANPTEETPAQVMERPNGEDIPEAEVVE